LAKGKDALILGDNPIAATGRTYIDRRAWLSSRASATAAGGVAPEIDVGDQAIDGIVERNVEIGGGVTTLLGTGSTARSAESEEVSEATEDVAQIFDPHPLPGSATAKSTLAPVVAIELLLGRAIARVGIGMELLGQLAIGAFDLIGRSRASHTEDLIEVLVNPVAIQGSIIPCG
jgi:hypothetical protein